MKGVQMFVNKKINTNYIQIVDHHNYTIETVSCRNMSKRDVANMIKAFRFYENNYAHPRVDAYDGYDTPTLKPTIPNQDCVIYFYGKNGYVYEYKEQDGKVWLHLTTSMDAHPLNQDFRIFKRI
tara:strand:+ start:136 stop:507 length:372 start_codon:yes stop_codon:yes gene_type:complete